jgi:prepilin-type N-terminal cleavage/methylation domain-containing protein
MDLRTSLRRLQSRRGITLLEVVVCLAVLGLFVSGFVRHLSGNAGARSRLADRERAEGVARAVRALLAAEDPWTAPAFRSLTLDAHANPTAPSALAYEVRISGSVLCGGGWMPVDNAVSSPGGCPDEQRALRRWHVSVDYPTLYAETQRDTVTSVVDLHGANSPTHPLGSLP